MTNRHRNVLYVGVTNNLYKRVAAHENRMDKGFSKKYNCQYLIYYEEFHGINNAIKRGKELKGWRRSKKDALISLINTQFQFLNKTLNSL